MDALNFLKFWRPTTINPLTTNGAPNPLVKKGDEFEEEEEEDSFFDLELLVSDIDIKKNKTNADPETNTDKENKTRLDSNQNNLSKKAVLNFSDPTLSLSPTDSISRRKILPIEPNSKPQSPISLLKSAPSFQVLKFKKPRSKSMAALLETERRESKTISMDTHQKQLRKQESKAATLKFKVEEEDPNNSLLTRAYSSRKNESKLQSHQASEDSKTERFSKDLMQKYLNLIKPLYDKVSKRYSDKIKLSDELSVGSPASSPATMAMPKKEKQGNIPAGIRVVCKHLGKSKSSSAIGAVPVVNRRDDSLLQQHDGIQSAILHCKRSFNGSRAESSSLSRSITLHEKASTSYSRDLQAILLTRN
ncbi:probable membrane-associated kinase regulator 5 isoform X3 [Quercus lobata]|uniref:probable membrane-associated kinase regulator 5 isoform X3 n=1 Tax=Quercus lobata TaxID=97700 RepID=UPI0012459563|nr:probable membrane-associated kinase regulator 5 isoform X3 [Quercus lobata]